MRALLIFTLTAKTAHHVGAGTKRNVFVQARIFRAMLQQEIDIRAGKIIGDAVQQQDRAALQLPANLARALGIISVPSLRILVVADFDDFGGAN